MVQGFRGFGLKKTQAASCMCLICIGGPKLASRIRAFAGFEGERLGRETFLECHRAIRGIQEIRASGGTGLRRTIAPKTETLNPTV